MLNETDLDEYYEILKKKQDEYSKTHKPILEHQIDLIQQIIALQLKLIGLRS
jgi:hypothetical protein